MSDIATLGIVIKSNGINEASNGLDNLTNKGKAAEGQQDKLANSNKKLGSSFESLQKYIGMVQGAFAALGIGMVIKDFISAAMEMDKLTRQFTVFTGSATLAGKEMQFVKEQANRLGLDMRSLTASYALFMNAIKGTANEGQKGRDAFVGISEGMAAVGMAADKQGAAWAQLNQGIMKGKFEMEDLKTINEAGLPIFKLMADALGVTTSEFMKMQAEGRVLANDVLPKLGKSMHEAYGVAALEGAMSAQGAINKMNNAMLESKAVAGSALMPVFTDLVINVFTPLVNLIGQAVKGLQNMAAAAALAANQLITGLGGVLTGKIFSKDGYRQIMAESLENEAIYKASMEKIWKTPTSSDYSAAERMKQGGGKISADVDDKAVKAAEKARQRELDDIARRDVLATDIWNKEQRRLSETAYWLSDHDKGVLKINNDYEQIIETQAKSVPFSKEQLATLEQMRVTAIARFTAEEKYNASIKDAEQSEKDRLELLRLQSKELERQQAVIKYIADLNAANSATAASMVGMNSVGGFDSIEEQTANQMAVLADAHKTRLDMIELERAEKIASLKGINDAEKRAAEINTALNTKAELEKRKNTIATAAITDKSFKSQLSMTSQYVGMAGQLFTALASTQDQSSRKGFETAKMYNTSAAVMSTAGAIMNALATVQPYPLALAAAGVAAATGAIQIAQIQSTSFGGSGSVSAPSGSFGGASGASGSGTGISNLPQHISTIADSRSNESIDKLIGSTDNASLVIGRLSKSIDSLNDLFSAGGAGFALANNAPNKFVVTSELQNATASYLKNLLTAGGNFLGLDAMSTIKAGVSAVFGGDWQTTGAGISLGVTGGNVTARDYVVSQKDGGYFHSDKTSVAYTDNNEAAAYLNEIVTDYFSDITNMARTLGTTVDTSALNLDSTNIATAGRSSEDIAKDMEKWMTEALQAMSLTVEGLDGFSGTYDDAYTVLKTLNDALVSTNEAFTLIGKTALDSSMDSASWAVSLQNMFGGMDAFTTAMDDYFSAMYTDTEQAAMKAAAAQVDVNNSFKEFGLEIPKTNAEFNALRNSVTDPALFHALTMIGPTFAEMTKYAEELAAAQRDMNMELLSLKGLEGSADYLRLLNEQREAEIALLDPSLQALQRQINAQIDLNAATEATATATATATTALRNSIDAELKMLQERAAITAKASATAATVLDASYAAQRTIIVEGQTAILDTLKNSLSEATEAASELQSTFDMLKSARVGMQLSNVDSATMAAAQADLASILNDARNGDTSRIAGMGDTAQIVSSVSAESYTNSADYQRAFWQTSNSLLELENITGKQLTDAQQQVESLNKLITTTTTANTATLKAFDAELNAIKGISTNVLPIAEARANYLSAQVANTASQLELTTQTAWLNKQYDMLTNVNTSVLSVQEAMNNLAGLLGKPAPSAVAPANPLAAYAGTDSPALRDAKVQAQNKISYDSSDTGLLAAAKALYASTHGGANTAYYNAAAASVGGDIGAALGWDGSMEDTERLRKLYSFDVGTNYVPYDMTAQIHEGERIIPKADNYRLSQDNKEMIAELKALRAEMKIQAAETAKNTQKTAKILDQWNGDGMPIERAA